MRGHDPRGKRVLLVPHLVISPDTQAYPVDDGSRATATGLAGVLFSRQDIGLMTAPALDAEHDTRLAQIEAVARDLTDYYRDGYGVAGLMLEGLPQGGIHSELLGVVMERRGVPFRHRTVSAGTSVGAIREALDELFPA